MNYLAQAKITEDNFVIQRVKACAAGNGVREPHEWVMKHIWNIAASEGWGAAYGPELEKEDTTDPAAWGGQVGANPEVITDQMILDAVQRVLTEETARETEPVEE